MKDILSRLGYRWQGVQEMMGMVGHGKETLGDDSRYVGHGGGHQGMAWDNKGMMEDEE